MTTRVADRSTHLDSDNPPNPARYPQAANPADTPGMDTPTKLLLLGLFVVAATMVTAILRVLGAWSSHHIHRHDLIVESKRRRLEYFRAVAERKGLSNETIEVLD